MLLRLATLVADAMEGGVASVAKLERIVSPRFDCLGQTPLVLGRPERLCRERGVEWVQEERVADAEMEAARFWGLDRLVERRDGERV